MEKNKIKEIHTREIRTEGRVRRLDILYSKREREKYAKCRGEEISVTKETLVLASYIANDTEIIAAKLNSLNLCLVLFAHLQLLCLVTRFKFIC